MIPQFKIAELENLWTKEGARRNVKEKSIVENKELNQALLVLAYCASKVEFVPLELAEMQYLRKMNKRKLFSS